MRAILASALLVLASSPFMAHGAATSIKSRHDADTVVPVTLGQSVIALTGPWKFHVGDDPQWADPGFDDSQWETVDLTPTPQTTVPGVPIPGFVAGWEARGHPGYAGYAWYRMRVRISGATGPLTLLAPEWFDNAFQVFANGRLIGSFGDFNGPVPVLYEGNPAKFTLPASDYGTDPDGSTLIAFRFYMAAGSLGTGVRGGMHGPPRIGLPGAANAVFHMEWEREIRRLASALAALLLYFLFALLIAMIFAFSRTEKILLWPLTASVFEVIHFALIFSTNLRWMSEVRLESLIGFATIVAGYLWLLTWWAYFRLQQTRWLFNAILGWGLWNLCHGGILRHHLAYRHAFSLADHCPPNQRAMQWFRCISADRHDSVAWLEAHGTKAVASLHCALLLFLSGFRTRDEPRAHANRMATLRRPNSHGLDLSLCFADLLLRGALPPVPHVIAAAAGDGRRCPTGKADSTTPHPGAAAESARMDDRKRIPSRARGRRRLLPDHSEQG